MNFTTYSIGRSADADIRVDESSVSRRHAELVVTAGGEYYLTDCASNGGTFVVRDGAWSRITQQFVTLDEPILLGAHITSIRRLLDARARARGGRDAASPHAPRGLPGTRSREFDPRDALPEGPVLRNPETGEIVEQR